MDLVVKKCKSCGATVKALKDCNCKGCGIVCCETPMEVVIPNSVDAAVVKDNKIYVTVNHVMEEDHYIEWISIVSEGRECTAFFKPGMEAKAHFKYIPRSTIYAYCNKHELWKKDVE